MSPHNISAGIEFSGIRNGLKPNAVFDWGSCEIFTFMNNRLLFSSDCSQNKRFSPQGIIWNDKIRKTHAEALWGNDGNEDTR